MGTTKTTKILRETRKPPEKALENRKLFTERQKLITNSLANGLQSIPDIAKESGLEPEVVTYVMMSMRKYGEVTEIGPDEMNEYFLYQLKPKNP